jgi:hypothetical protein
MKWTNKGHELDKLGSEYIKITNLFLWGAGKYGMECVFFLDWLKPNDFKITFVDSNPDKQGKDYCGHDVISPQALFGFGDKKQSAVVITFYNNSLEIMKMVEEKGFSDRVFFWQLPEIASSNLDNGFVRKFLCVYYLYKYGKLVSHWTNYLATTKCTLNCRGCLNMTSFIKHPKDTLFEEFRSHIDTVFTKYDYLYAFHFTGGEPFLCKDLLQMMDYITAKYGNKVYDRFIVTNGTVIPSESLFEAIKRNKFWVAITDYTSSAPKIAENLSKLKQELCNHNIQFTSNTPTDWRDLEIGLVEINFTSEEEIIKHHDTCNLFWHTFQNGKIYTCSYPSFAETAGLYDICDCDYIDIMTAEKTELLEFEFGYCEKGYGGLCKKCNGFHQNTKKIPLEQLSVKSIEGE